MKDDNLLSFEKKRKFPMQKKFSFEKKDNTITSALRAEIIDYCQNFYFPPKKVGFLLQLRRISPT